jgi:hypothetical protein
MSANMLENIERELEMAAERLETNPGGEAESAGLKLWRYWDVLLSAGAGWETLYTLGPLQDSRDNAIRIRDELKRQWQPAAQSRGGTLLVRCLSFSPTSNQWLDCQNFSG